jgi:hypothetical protein
VASGFAVAIAAFQQRPKLERCAGSEKAVAKSKSRRLPRLPGER